MIHDEEHRRRSLKNQMEMGRICGKALYHVRYQKEYKVWLR
jgi:hypothetical protein